MVFNRERWLLIICILAVLAITCLPYIYASRNSGGDSVFGGFLLNPLDGNSYLAKMYEGWRGDWRFTLPYTAEKGKGSSIFLFYLVLGHLARATNLPLLTVFHLARGISIVLMVVALYRFIEGIFLDKKRRFITFVLASLGSGLGWLALSAGVFTSDFWVAEAYPFLSAFANPHFPLSLALILLLLTFPSENGLKSSYRVGFIQGMIDGLFALLLAIILPFGVVIVLLILGVLGVWEIYPRFSTLRNSPVIQRWFWIFLGGFPVLAYELWQITNDPLLSIWNSQNVTSSPPWWDFLISLSPVILLALIGGYSRIRSRLRNERLLLVWAVMGVILIYFPWSLQRRFMLGIYIPMSCLAVFGLGTLFRGKRAFNLSVIVLLLFVLPTNLIVLTASQKAVMAKDPKIFLTQEELMAFRWIETHTAQDAVVLTSTDNGLYIPAYTGRRVIYGHPYETVDAAAEKQRVTEFFQNASSKDAISLLNSVDFLYLGPREPHVDGLTDVDHLVIAYQNPDITVYRVIH
jgi:hypothetical protein